METICDMTIHNLELGMKIKGYLSNSLCLWCVRSTRLLSLETNLRPDSIPKWFLDKSKFRVIMKDSKTEERHCLVIHAGVRVLRVGIWKELIVIEWGRLGWWKIWLIILSANVPRIAYETLQTPSIIDVWFAWRTRITFSRHCCLRRPAVEEQTTIRTDIGWMMVYTL